MTLIGVALGLRLALSPWWVHGLVNGVPFGVVMTVFQVAQGSNLFPAVVGGGTSGVLFGLIVGPMMRRFYRRMLGELEVLPPAELWTVVRASSRGPAPADPRLREAARALVQRQRDEVLRNRRRSVAVHLVVLGLFVVLALTQESLWWLAAAMLFLGLLVLVLKAPARLERRLSALSDG